MGSWQLEVVKMFMYVMFPVGAFHVFNQPEIFTEFVKEYKSYPYYKVSEKDLKLAEDLKSDFRKRWQQRTKEEEAI